MADVEDAVVDPVGSGDARSVAFPGGLVVGAARNGLLPRAEFETVPYLAGELAEVQEGWRSKESISGRFLRGTRG